MADRPIMFSAPMIAALLAGRKTHTRRLATSPLRHAQPGDRLWVREAWKAVPASAYPGEKSTPNPSAPDEVAVYRAHWSYSSGGVPWRPSIHMPRWASRFTLVVTEVRVQQLIDITEADAMAEGVQEVRDPDRDGFRHFSVPGTMTKEWPTARAAFADFWESLHGAQSWTAGTDVVALTFTVARRNVDA